MRVAKTAFIRSAMAATEAASSERAPAGQTAMHRIQEMHFAVSVSLGASKGMAPAGHSLAQVSQPTQVSSASG